METDEMLNRNKYIFFLIAADLSILNPFKNQISELFVNFLLNFLGPILTELLSFDGNFDFIIKFSCVSFSALAEIGFNFWPSWNSVVCLPNSDWNLVQFSIPFPSELKLNFMKVDLAHSVWLSDWTTRLVFFATTCDSVWNIKWARRHYNRNYFFNQFFLPFWPISVERVMEFPAISIRLFDVWVHLLENDRGSRATVHAALERNSNWNSLERVPMWLDIDSTRIGWRNGHWCDVYMIESTVGRPEQKSPWIERIKALDFALLLLLLNSPSVWNLLSILRMRVTKSFYFFLGPVNPPRLIHRSVPFGPPFAANVVD